MVIVHWREGKIYREKIKIKKIFEDVAPGKYNQIKNPHIERAGSFTVKYGEEYLDFDIIVVDGKLKIFVDKDKLFEGSISK